MKKKSLTVQDYYPAPFWFLNHKLEKDELRRQIQLMHQQGITAFFMHPRAGLLTPYGTKSWFDQIRFIVEEAERFNMKAWLYDEDPFPSGPAGGRIFLDNPEFAARGLVFHELQADESGEIDADLGEGRLLEALAVRCDDAGNVVESYNVFDQVGMIRSDFFHTLWPSPYYVHLFGETEYPHYRAETFYPHLQLQVELDAGWKVYAVTAVTEEGSKYRYKPDNLNPDCVEAFIKLTHEKYKEHLGDKFGSVVPGIFTDETATGGVFAWTPRFAKEFFKRRGFTIENNYYRIFTGDCEENQHYREAYWQTVQELFIECFFIPINEWCKENSLALCGHGIGEEDPLATTNGMNIFALQKHVGIPGFDHITPNIPDGRHFKSLNLGGKLVSSAAEQLGEHRVQSECFGCNPYNFGHDGMRKNMHWLYALGVNWLVPHGFHYSYDGRRKDDAGKSFFFQSPDYNEFHRFAGYAARLGFKLGESRSLTSICVAFPESEFRKLISAQKDLAVEKRERLYECLQFLFDNHIQFEIADEESLKSATCENGTFRCGLRKYDTLIVPFHISGKYLEQFTTGGIKILNFPDETDCLLKIKNYKLRSSKNNDAATGLMTQYRQNANGRLLYIFNNRDENRLIKIELEQPSPGGSYIYDAGEDRYAKLESEQDFAIAPYGAVVIELRNTPLDCPAYELPPETKPDFTYMTDAQWDYVPQISGLLHAIRDWDFNFNGKDYGRQRYCLLREVAGTYGCYSKRMRPRPIFDLAPPAPSVYPGKMILSCSFELQDCDSVYLLAENDTFAGNPLILVNEQEVSDFERTRIYDPWNLICNISKQCTTGSNTLCLVWKEAEEFDGLNSMIYLIKGYVAV